MCYIFLRFKSFCLFPGLVSLVKVSSPFVLSYGKTFHFKTYASLLFVTAHFVGIMNAVELALVCQACFELYALLYINSGVRNQRLLKSQILSSLNV